MPMFNIMENVQDDSQYPNIKHLVISGGGTYGFLAYGALRETCKAGFWKRENIQSIHTVSVGGMIATMLLLDYDWETMDDYLIKRPWDKVFHYDVQTIFNAFENRGLFDNNMIIDIMKPLLLGKDVDLDITLKQFYEKTHIDLHLYATETTAFELVSLSHTTHPDWKLLDAMYASAGLPVFASPYIVGDKSYIDGGVFLNYPLKQCLNKEGVLEDEVFGVQKESIYTTSNEISNTSNLLDYILILLDKVLARINQDSENNGLIQHEMIIRSSPICATDLYQFSILEECRKNGIEEGVVFGRRFLANYKEKGGALPIVEPDL